MASDKRHVIAHALIGVLLVAAGVSTWGAVRLDDPSSDPNHAAVGTAGLFAVFFCCAAAVSLFRVARRGTGWRRVAVRLPLALLSLFALLLVAEATRLTG